MDKEPKPVSPEELELSYSVPTVIVNRFLVSTTPSTPGTVRIAFGESNAPELPTHYRVALQLTAFDANELKDLLERLLTPFEEEIRATHEVLDNAGSEGR